MIRSLLCLEGLSIEVHHKPIKNIHLRIYPPDGRVRISAPLSVSLPYIRAHLESKWGWIQQQRVRLQHLPNKKEPALTTGDTLYFLGKAYRLEVLDNTTLSEIALSDSVLQLHIKPHASIQDKQRLIHAWHHAEMQRIVTPLIAHWEPLMNVRVVALRTRLMTSRWGSCNTRTKQITLNLSLVQKPITCLSYVLVHEMVHLLEASHNERFYRLMTTFMPTWRTHQATLSSIGI